MIDEVRIYDRALTRRRGHGGHEHARRRTTRRAPTAPTAFAKTGATATTIATSWTASTDNVGVTGYRLYRDGTRSTPTTNTAYTFTGLTCNTSYTLGVEAVDAAGNVSPRTHAHRDARRLRHDGADGLDHRARRRRHGQRHVDRQRDARPTTTSVAGVQFKLDGANLGAEDTNAPYAFDWDTAARRARRRTR